MILLSCTDKLKSLPRLALVLFSAMLLLLLPACVEEQITPQDSEKTITFSVGVPKEFFPSTYGLTDTQEDYLNTVDVLLFKKDGDKEYISGPHYGVISGANVTIRIPSDAENYNMAVFANCRGDLNKTFSTSSTKTQILESLTKTVVEGNAGGGRIGGVDAGWLTTDGHKTIPMYGEYESGKVVSLVRMLVRINVTIDAEVPFTLSEVYLCNYNNKGRIAPASDWSEAKPSTVLSAQTSFAKSIRYVDAEGDGLKRAIYTFEADKGSVTTLADNTCLIIGGTYGGNTNYYRIDLVDTDGNYLNLLRNHTYDISVKQIIGIGYEDAATAFDSRAVNVTYTITSWDNGMIGDVVTDGQYSLSVSAPTLNFDAAERTINSEDNTITIACNYGSTVTINNITSDGDWLSVYNSEKNILQNNDAIPLLDGQAAICLVFGDNSGGNNRAGSFVLTAGRMNYTVNVSQNNQVTEIIAKVPEPEANCYIVPPLGAILIPVSRANASDEIGIQLNDGDAFVTELVWTDNSNGIAHNSNIKTIASVGSGGSGYIYVETGRAEGNAVVGIRKKNTEGDAEGGFLWSWHIWVTTYNPNNPNSANGFFMDRNLGATSAIAGDAGTIGLHYQWGRKDPFPASTSLEWSSERTLYFGKDVYSRLGNNRSGKIKTVNINDDIQSNSTYPTVLDYSQDNNLGYAVSNPHIFYSSNSYPNDWYVAGNGSQNNNLWDDDSKTVYDPCPTGWRLPTLSHWIAALNGNTENSDNPTSVGWIWGDYGYIALSEGSWVGDQVANTYFPATGYRYYGDGIFYDSGLRGGYWSSFTGEGIFSRTLTLYENYMYSPSSYGDYRAIGLSVRCVSESAWDVVIEDSSNASIVGETLSFEDFRGILPTAQTIKLQAPFGATVTWSGNNNFNISGPGTTTSNTTSYSVQPKAAITNSETYSDPITCRVTYMGKEIVKTFISRQTAFVFENIQPESNSYIVAPNASILIPVSRANKSIIGTQLNDGDIFTAELVWTDNLNGIASNSNIKMIAPVKAGSGNYIYVETGSLEGNAVVAIKKSGKILWSWHIWVTTYNPSLPAKGYFMDRNLGAFDNGNPHPTNKSSFTITDKSVGLMYQWGRKDPFPGAVGVSTLDISEPQIYYGTAATPRGGLTTLPGIINSIAVTPEIGIQRTIAYSVGNPDVFIRVLEVIDWCTDLAGADSPRWGHNSDKSIYDPCPPGWRIPNDGFWTSSGWLPAVTNLGQRNDNFGGVYPAAGYRNRDSGLFLAIGEQGLYWMAIGDSEFLVRVLYFYDNLVYDSGVSDRVTAQSVRCVGE